jgi:hypothetical protein
VTTLCIVIAAIALDAAFALLVGKFIAVGSGSDHG